MNDAEQTILRKTVAHKGGLLSPAEMINGIAARDRASVEKLVTFGYLQEVPQDQQTINGPNYSLNFYRVTPKGFSVLEPWPKRIWLYVQGDVRNVVVSVITAFLTTLLTILVARLFK